MWIQIVLVGLATVVFAARLVVMLAARSRRR
jgi:hypothetical protein